MDFFWKAIGAALIAVILALLLEPQSKNFTIVLTVVVTGMIATVAAQFFEPVLDFMTRLEKLGDINHSILLILMKIIGVGLAGEISAAVCKDAGNTSLEKSLCFLTNAAIFYLSVPIFSMLIDLIQQILKGI